MTIDERIEKIEFQLELLYTNSPIDRLFFETSITREQRSTIMNLFDSLRDKIENGQSIEHYEYEQGIYEIVPERDGDYHFCELIAKLFSEEGQWEEVFLALYADMPKYGGTQLS